MSQAPVTCHTLTDPVTVSGPCHSRCFYILVKIIFTFKISGLNVFTKYFGQVAALAAAPFIRVTHWNIKSPTEEVVVDQAFTFSIQILQFKMLFMHSSVIQMFTFLIQAAWELEPFSSRRILPFSQTVLWSSYFLIYQTLSFVSEECLRWCKSY